MHVTKEGSVDQFKNATYDRNTIWKKDRGENATSISWDIFQMTFLNRFFPCDIRESKVEDFINLR